MNGIALISIIIIYLIRFFVWLSALHRASLTIAALLMLLSRAHRPAVVRQIHSQPDFRREIIGRHVAIIPNKPIDTSPSKRMLLKRWKRPQIDYENFNLEIKNFHSNWNACDVSEQLQFFQPREKELSSRRATKGFPLRKQLTICKLPSARANKNRSIHFHPYSYLMGKKE